MNNKNRYVDNFLIGWQTKGRLKNEKRYANVSSSTLVNSLSIVFTSFYGIVLLPFSLEKWFQEFPFLVSYFYNFVSFGCKCLTLVRSYGVLQAICVLFISSVTQFMNCSAESRKMQF